MNLTPLLLGSCTTRAAGISGSDPVTGLLGGTIQINGQALSSTNTMDEFALTARNGTLTIGTPLYFNTPQYGGISYLMAEKVQLKANVIGYGSSSDLYISAHRNSDGAYALSVDPGVHLSASQVHVDALP